MKQSVVVKYKILPYCIFVSQQGNNQIQIPENFQKALYLACFS